MRLEDFDFDLPEALIAIRPVKPRSAAQLLVAEGDDLRDRHVFDLADELRPGDRLVFNNTKVLPARLFGQRERQTSQGASTAKIEITLAESLDDEGVWCVLAKPLRKLATGDVLQFQEGLTAVVLSRERETAVIRFDLRDKAFEQALAKAGAMPLPPYIAAKRAADEHDKDDYQTIFARHQGAVAAPTASLHFDASLLDALRNKGVAFTEVTLHVGAGTFLPVKVDDIKDHKMHAEWGEISPKAAEDIKATKAAGGRVIPVGTTALRLIETAARNTGEVTPWQGETDIFIYPGFRFQVSDGLMTNFHLPKSTLILLVSAFLGAERIRRLYAHAIAHRYRFFSYGDASLLLP